MLQEVEVTSNIVVQHDTIDVKRQPWFQVFRCHHGCDCGDPYAQRLSGVSGADQACNPLIGDYNARGSYALNDPIDVRYELTTDFRSIDLQVITTSVKKVEKLQPNTSGEG